MKIAQKLTELVGNTPLLQLNKFSAINKVEGATILAKLEYFNPAGSVKDRVALATWTPRSGGDHHRAYLWQHWRWLGFRGSREGL